EASGDVNLTGFAEQLDAVGGDRVSDEDPNGGDCGRAGLGRDAHTGTGSATALVAELRASACAAATARPRRLRRPTSTSPRSSVARIAYTSASPIQPRWPMRKILPCKASWPPASTRP